MNVGFQGLALLLQQPRNDTINSDRVSQLASRANFRTLESLACDRYGWNLNRRDPEQIF